MNKEIKIIDLLNMIAEGRTPKKIKYDGEFYIFNKEKDNYYEDDESCSINWDYVVFYCLNESVEIIEEDNNKIEKDLHPYGSCSDEDLYNGLVNKLYKVIDYINEKWGMYE